MSSKVMTSVKLPGKIEQQMLQAVISHGYGMRGKSQWVIEAIQNFLSLEDYPELTDIADDMDMLDKMVSIRMPEELSKRIDNAIIQVRQYYPAMEGVKSNIIRASIMQRLIREPIPALENIATY